MNLDSWTEALPKLHVRTQIPSPSAVKQRGQERKGPPEIIQKFRLRNWPISSADFPMTPVDRVHTKGVMQPHAS